MRGHSSSAREEWPALFGFNAFPRFFSLADSFSPPQKNKSRSLTPHPPKAGGWVRDDNLYFLYSFGQLKIGPV
jgi:hypothetical protein